MTKIAPQAGEPSPSPAGMPPNLVGRSPAFLEMVRVLRRVAACDANVLIQGETGTGKEMAARSVHYLGTRAPYPFLPVNCGAIPDTLIESELFGNVRGAFTDARESRRGVIEQAEGGTLFLDEVEALSPRGQVALLRFLQDGEYRPVGGVTPRRSRVRVIAASNAELSRLAAKGQFRQDLLFRLNVLCLDLPPLRERPGDAVLLAQAFLRRLARQYGQALRELHPDTVRFLESHPWPGNVRELENLIHRHLLLTDGPEIVIRGDGEPERRGGRRAEGFQEAKARAIAEFERAFLMRLLTQTQGNLSLAARICGTERSRLGKLVKKHGLDRGAFSEEGGG